MDIVRDNAAKLKVDLGCGTNKQPGFIGVDRRSFAGVDGVTDLTQKHWYFEQARLGETDLVKAGDGHTGYLLPDHCISEAYCSHFLEHLEHNQRYPERVRFMNELWRVMSPGGKALIITPHWASNRAYGDFTHADKPVSEMFYSYLSREWRKLNAPDNDAEFHPDGYTCNFETRIGHSLHPEIQNRLDNEKAFAIAWHKEAAYDLVATLTACE
jgi:hypothetical protein